MSKKRLSKKLQATSEQFQAKEGLFYPEDHEKYYIAEIARHK